MDPVAHTMVGAVLAETGLKRVSRYTTATLLIGVNLPDIDGIAKFWGHDASLFFRRGWSHGIVALVVLPLLLAGLIWLWHRWRGKTGANDQIFRFKWIIILSFLAVWTHPLLDWMNTYGVRLLMPFDGRWFYGDTLFIIDPWIWLVLAAGIILARKKHLGELVFWVLLGVISSWIILTTEHANIWIQSAWCSGIVFIAVLRANRSHDKPAPSYARSSTTLVIIYICAAYGVARITESTMAERYETPLQSQVNPLPGQPFSHRTILVYDDYYLVVGQHGETYEIPRQEPDKIVQTALQSETIRGFVNWMRFPFWEVVETEQGWLVKFQDLRYQGPGARGASIGYAEVEVPYSEVNRNPD